MKKQYIKPELEKNSCESLLMLNASNKEADPNQGMKAVRINFFMIYDEEEDESEE